MDMNNTMNPPRCAAIAHDWRNPYEYETIRGLLRIVGVIGPGSVVARADSIIVTEVCSRCGHYQERDIAVR
mgnify:CR=1 FL=1